MLFRSLSHRPSDCWNPYIHCADKFYVKYSCTGDDYPDFYQYWIRRRHTSGSLYFGMCNRRKHSPGNPHWDSLRHPDLGCWLPIQRLRMGRPSDNCHSDPCNLPAVSGYVWLSSNLTVSQVVTGENCCEKFRLDSRSFSLYNHNWLGSLPQPVAAS